MAKSNLVPFIRENLHVLFVGLNPAKGSSDNRHYFSVKQSFWNQLYDAGLITSPLDKMDADDYVFGSNSINYNNWDYGITDLITDIAESDSRRINPSREDCIQILKVIIMHNPKVVILLHGKVTKAICRYLHINVPSANSGKMGKLLPNTDTIFYNIAFPHGNAIFDVKKIDRYTEVKEYLIKITNDKK